LAPEFYQPGWVPDRQGRRGTHFCRWCAVWCAKWCIPVYTSSKRLQVVGPATKYAKLTTCLLPKFSFLHNLFSSNLRVLLLGQMLANYVKAVQKAVVINFEKAFGTNSIDYSCLTRAWLVNCTKCCARLAEQRGTSDRPGIQARKASETVH
jgi:hypothetical protein